ncbi:MAG TPA: FUN14 domain-containing protein [Nitrososphaera sp.]|nr:FUN14 domain-containing protein [Nitrososphaera sp.]
MDFNLGFIASSIGFGGVAGFLVGYAIKKVFKITLFLVGLFIAAMGYFSYLGILSVNWDKLGATASDVTTGLGNTTGQATAAGDQLVTALVNFGIPFTGTFAAAFVFGFIKG